MLIAWLSIPALGGVAGWCALWLAFGALFHPRRPRLGLHGVLPRRQSELAASIARGVAAMVKPSDLLSGVEHLDLTAHVAAAVEQAIAAKFEDLRGIPLIGSLVTPERLAGIAAAVVKQLAFAQPALVAQAKRVLDEGLDLEGLVRERLLRIDLVVLEAQVRSLLGAELRRLCWLGALYGVVIGLIQAAALLAMTTLLVPGR